MILMLVARSMMNASRNTVYFICPSMLYATAETVTSIRSTTHKAFFSPLEMKKVITRNYCDYFSLLCCVSHPKYKRAYLVSKSFGFNRREFSVCVLLKQGQLTAYFDYLSYCIHGF